MLRRILNKVKSHGVIKTAGYAAMAAVRPAARFLQASHSQAGEDLIIDRLLGFKPYGTYVDIGAFHHSRLSNTCRFYRRGWRGWNVEPNPAAMKDLIWHRGRDVNLRMGVAAKAGCINFHIMDPAPLSTFDARSARNATEKYGARLIEVIKVETTTLALLFARINQRVDFLTVDCEGFDLEILQSNDWTKHRPAVVCVECSGGSVRSHMEGAGYARAAVTRLHGNDLNEIFVSRA